MTTASFFQRNAANFTREELAFALRAVLVGGPSKTPRVPLLVGGTNTGKTTVVVPIDSIFGYKHVMHKPSLKSSFALRNLSNKGKRSLARFLHFHSLCYGALQGDPM